MKYRSIVTVALAIILLVALSITAFADTFTYGYSGSSCNTLIKSKNETSTNSGGTKKQELTQAWYGGSSYYFGWHSITDRYFHVKGAADLSTTGKVYTTHTFKASFSVGVESIFGTSSDYSMSVTTDRSITHSIDPNLASGFYYYGARARTRDMRYVATTKYYEKKNGKWVLVKTEIKPQNGCMLYNRRYYSWVRDH